MGMFLESSPTIYDTRHIAVVPGTHGIFLFGDFRTVPLLEIVRPRSYPSDCPIPIIRIIIPSLLILPELFPSMPGTSGEESTCQWRRQERQGFNLQVRKIPGEGDDNPLHYSCLQNRTDRGAWQVTVHGVAKESDTTERLNHHVPQDVLHRVGAPLGVRTILADSVSC